MDTQKTLAFLHELSEQAQAEARGGSVDMLEGLRRNSAFGHYYANVFAIGSMKPDVWARNYPAFIQSANKLREEYEKVEADEQRMTTLEDKIAELGQKIDAFLEAQKGEQPKAKRGKKQEAEVEDETPDEPEGDDESEG